MGWLAPIWLVALAAIGVPLYIHLRRRRIGRRIQVGSIRHLAGTATPRRRRLQVRDPWLLALRSLIVALPAVALAEPVLPRRDPPARWVLAAPEIMNDAGARAVLDSLRRGGASVRLLAPGFPTPGAATGIDSALDLWAALPAADRELPAGSRITLVLRPRLGLARGSRPEVGAAVDIHPVGRGDTSSAVEGTWTSRGIASRLIETPAGGGVRTAIRSGPAEGMAGAVDADSIAVRVVADSPDLPGARYVEAAFRAAAEATHTSPAITTTSPAAFRPGDVGPGDWTVWVSASSRPALPGVVVTDERAGASAVNGAGGTTDQSVVPAVEEVTPARPGSRELHFRSRLDRTGGSLLLSPMFPELIAQRWLDWSLAGGRPELGRQAISTAQLLPRRGPPAASAGRLRSFRRLLLGLAALLFLGERWLAFRRP